MPGLWTPERKCPALSEMKEQRGKQRFGPGSLGARSRAAPPPRPPALSVGLEVCGDTPEGLRSGTQQGEGRLLFGTNPGPQRVSGELGFVPLLLCRVGAGRLPQLSPTAWDRPRVPEDGLLPGAIL